MKRKRFWLFIGIVLLITIILAVVWFFFSSQLSFLQQRFVILFAVIGVGVATVAAIFLPVIDPPPPDQNGDNASLLLPFTPAEMKERFGEYGSNVTWIDRGVSKVRDLRAYGRLVIIGPMKIGKTREAYELMRRAVAENLVLESRLYRLNPSYFDLIQDENITFPSDIDREQPLLILIDDFPFHYKPDKLEKLGEFLSTLTCCKQVYLIATARFDQLTDEHDMWLEGKKFQPIKMLDLDEDQTRSLVDNASGVFGLQMDSDARELFVKKNDGTPQLPLMAMQRLRANDTMQVDAKTSAGVMEENITEQWLATRRYIEEHHPCARYIFESLITFSQAIVRPYQYFVFQYALYLWKQDKSQKGNHKKKKLEEAFAYLEYFGIVGFEKWFIYPDYVVESNHSSHIDMAELGNFLLRHRRMMANWLLRRFYLQANEHAWTLWYFLRHNIYSETENFEKFDHYAKQICHRSRSTALYNNLGVLLDDLNRKTEAEEMYYKAIAIDPQNASSYFNIGILMNGQQRETEAEEMYRKVITVNPQYAEAYYNLGVLLLRQGREAEAEEMYRKVIEVDPQCALAYSNLGLLLAEQNHAEEAEEMYQKAIKSDPEITDTYINLGILLYKYNREEEAEEMWRKAIKGNPQKAEAYGNLGNLLRKHNELIEAEEMYQMVIKIDPLDKLVYYNLACLESLRGNTDQAFAFLMQAINLDKDNCKWACEDSDFDNIRDDARFEQIAGCSNLP